MRVTITVTDDHVEDGRLTYHDSAELLSIDLTENGNRTLRIEADRVVLGPRVLLRRTPPHHEMFPTHPWLATGKDGRVWKTFTVEVSE